MSVASHQGGVRRALLDFAPMVTFFIAYKLAGLMAATATMIAVTLAYLTFIYVTEKRVAILPLVSGVLVMLFGTLTLVLQDELFIKLRPTIVNALFGTVMAVGLYGFRSGWMKHLLGFAFPLSDQGWWMLSRRWMLFFFFMAGLNECVWRNVSTDLWVDIKVFGYMGLTLCFAFAQLRFIERHKADA